MHLVQLSIQNPTSRDKNIWHDHFCSVDSTHFSVSCFGSISFGSSGIWLSHTPWEVLLFFISLMCKSCSGLKNVSLEINGMKTVFLRCLEICAGAVFHDDAYYTSATPSGSVRKHENIFYINLSIFWLQVRTEKLNL